MTTRRGPWILFWVTVVALLGVVAFVTVSAVDPAIRGTRGTAVITHCLTRRGAPSCYGSFRTDDGKITIADEWIQGEDDASPGQRVTAYYTSHNGEVATFGSTQDIVYAAITIALLLAAVVTQFWFLVIRPRHASTRNAAGQ